MYKKQTGIKTIAKLYTEKKFLEGKIKQIQRRVDKVDVEIKKLENFKG